MATLAFRSNFLAQARNNSIGLTKSAIFSSNKFYPEGIISKDRGNDGESLIAQLPLGINPERYSGRSKVGYREVTKIEFQNSAELAISLERWLCGCSPTRRDMLQLLKLLDYPDKQSAYRMVSEWCFSQPSFDPCAADFLRLLSNLSSHGLVQPMEDLFQRMKSMELSPEVGLRAFSMMIQCYGKAGMTQKAEEAMEEMLRQGIPPDVKFFSAAMAAYGRNGQPQKAEEILWRMPTLGCLPDLSCFHVVMSAYARQAQPSEVRRLLSHLLSQRSHYPETAVIPLVVPTVRTYTTLMDAHLRAGQFQAVSQVFSAMLSAGGIECDDPALSLAVRALSAQGHCAEAVQLVSSMERAMVGHVRKKERASFVGLQTMNALILMFAAHSHVLEAEEVYAELGSRRLQPNAESLVGLCRAYLAQGRAELVVDRCRQVLREACESPRRKVKPGAVAGGSREWVCRRNVSAVVDFLAQEGWTTAAQEVESLLQPLL